MRNQKVMDDMEIKSYSDVYYGIHTVRITIKHYRYAGHIIQKIRGNSKGRYVLNFDFEHIDCELESDCNLFFNDDKSISAILKDESGNTLEYIGSARDFNNMIVAVEIIDFEY